MATEYKRIDSGWLVKMDDGDVFEVISPEGVLYFDTPSCKCRPIFITLLNSIMVGGSDDCPVHGFGTDEETAIGPKLDVFCPNCGRSVLEQFEGEENISSTEQDAYLECSLCGADIHIIYEYKLIHIQVA